MTDLLFPDLAPPDPVLPPPDPLAEALIAHQLVPNEFILSLNKELTIPQEFERPYPWNLPSRLFIFPIEVTDQLADGSRRIGLMHPLLVDHPYVQVVEKTLGVTIDRECVENDYGYSKSSIGTWWHAVDLITTGNWQALLDTARFTTSGDIAGAVSFGLHYSPHEGRKRNGYLSTVQAREIMTFLDSSEPADREAIIREQFISPSPCQSEKGSTSWPVNYMGDKEAVAWGMIHGIECGWFAHDRAGFLGWTEKGRTRFPPADIPPRQEQKPLQPESERPEQPAKPAPAKITADEIAPRPAAKATVQLDLF